MASNKNKGAPAGATDGGQRPYRLKERAKKMEETRRRITEAVVELHRTVGPARTTVSEIAERAGVRRMTVYNHFANDVELIDACSSHFIAGNPPPDPSRWAAITERGERLATALGELYPYYRANADMLGNVLRDAAIVPALDQINRLKWWPYIDAVVDVLRGDDTATARLAAIRLVVAFPTWENLTASGLDDTEAADLAAAMVRCAVTG